MSIVRIGLAETKHFSEGYEAIFGKKKERKPAEAAGKKRKAAKKKTRRR